MTQKTKLKIKPMVGDGVATVIEAGPEETIGSVKEIVAEIQNIHNPKDIILMKDGIALDNNKTVSDYHLRDGDTLDMTVLSYNGSRPPLSPSFSRRIEKERQIIRRNNLPIQFIDGIRWIAFIRARSGRWSGKTYKVSIELLSGYPYSPPRVRFLEKLIPHHPNISNDTGWICTNILRKANWRPDFNLSTVYDTLRQVLEKPNYKDPVPSYINEKRKKNRPTPQLDFVEQLRQFQENWSFDYFFNPRGRW